MSQYNAHRCTGAQAYEYHMLMLESMDDDTETRRVSPIGIMDVDNSEERYFDLINGPQDHGWCMGYTCQKRLSTFPIVFAASKCSANSHVTVFAASKCSVNSHVIVSAASKCSVNSHVVIV